MQKFYNPVENLLSQYYDFRRNPVLDRTEYKKKREKNFLLLTERDFNSILRVVRQSFPTFSIANLRSILNSDFIQDVDPFVEYFQSLDNWDLTDTDFIGQLADTIKVRNNTYWKEYFKKWLVSCVACALDEEKVNHQVLVLVGPQGIGKSSWLNSLLPKELSGYLYSGLINPNNKDTLVHLSENLFINLDELENLNKTELGSLKSLITQSAIKLRKAYGMFNENLRRRASFMGSVNDAEFLTDSTGNRRYLCFTCEKIDYQNNIDIDMVYAQAYALYKSKNFIYWFEPKDILNLEKINSEFIRISSEEDLLLKFFEPTTLGDKDRLELSPFEIMDYINSKLKSPAFDKNTSSRRLGQALHKFNFIKVSRKSRKPYLLKAREIIEEIPTQKFDKALLFSKIFDENCICEIDTSIPLSINFLNDFSDIKSKLKVVLLKDYSDNKLKERFIDSLDETAKLLIEEPIPELDHFKSFKEPYTGYYIPLQKQEPSIYLDSIIEKIISRIGYYEEGKTAEPFKKIGSLSTLLVGNYKKSNRKVNYTLTGTEVPKSKVYCLYTIEFIDTMGNKLSLFSFGYFKKDAIYVMANDLKFTPSQPEDDQNKINTITDLLSNFILEGLPLNKIDTTILLDLEIKGHIYKFKIETKWEAYTSLK